VRIAFIEPVSTWPGEDRAAAAGIGMRYAGEGWRSTSVSRHPVVPFRETARALIRQHSTHATRLLSTRSSRTSGGIPYFRRISELLAIL
jgi:hypothetical protein